MEANLLWLPSCALDSRGAAFSQRQTGHRAAAARDELLVGKFSMPGLMRNQRLIVKSWRQGHEAERVQVIRDDFNRFQISDPVVIEIRNGLAGIPWVYGVFRP